ncbi:arginase family protein [Candidatus Woesearchaeota archaeon]|nr:arginase family protein [Candidatus Woesearchaeota archaeon]
MKLIKIPSSQGGLGKSDGSELAPDEVIKQARDLFLNENAELPVFEIDEVKVASSNLEETNKNIFNKAMDIFAKNEKAAFIGGDHSITYPIARAFSNTFNKNPGIIIFDAHPDAEDYFMPPTQEDLLPAMIHENLIKAANIILVGIRNWHSNELEFLKKNKIRFFNMKEITEEGLHESCEAVMSIAKNFDALYISIDIDAVDPAFAPGTGYIEPGGLTSRELIYFLQRLKFLKNIKALDISEINPKKDINSMTSKLGAKICVEMS